MNIIISGWPATGASTAAKLMALTLDMKYLYGGGMLKYWADQMGFDSKTNEINEWTEKYGKYWDKFWDIYAKWKIENSNNLIIDSKILGFFVKSSNNTKEIYLIASLEARRKRVGTDKRTEDVILRDNILRESWLDTYNIDIFDKESLQKNYNFVLDTSEIPIPDVALRILNFLDSKKAGQFDAHQKKLQVLMDQYLKDPRDFLNSELVKRDSYYPKEAIIKEWNTSEFDEPVNELPEEMRKAIALV
jgi:cytidylate kinase